MTTLVQPVTAQSSVSHASTKTYRIKTSKELNAKINELLKSFSETNASEQERKSRINQELMDASFQVMGEWLIEHADPKKLYQWISEMGLTTQANS